MIRSLCALVVCAIGLRAQTFDAADIHVSAGIPAIHLPSLNSPMRGGQLRQGRYEVDNATILDLIRTAYRIDADKITGGPAWVDTERFDVVASVPSDATPESVRLMLQALLADRFGLSVHRDTKRLPGLALVAGKRVPLKSSTEVQSGCQAKTQEGAIQTVAVSCSGVTMAEFASQLPQIAGAYLMGNPVADLTGLEGRWSFAFKMTARNWLAAAGSDGVSLSSALEKQTGLRLETREIPTPVLVVDRVNRKPTDNAFDISQRLPVLPAKFEVADIRPAGDERARRVFRSQPGGLVELRSFTVGELIKMAWEIADLDAIDHDELVAGAPAWTERFDIVARAPGPERLDPGSVRLLLQALLVERFRLKSHVEKRMVTVEALTALKPKLRRADSSSRSGCRNAASPGDARWTFTVVCRNATMALLAESLQAFGASYIAHPVIDATGLEGGWDFSLSWSPPHLAHVGDAMVAGDPNGGLTIPEALERQLGLKLRMRKHLMDVLVIDHVERGPTEN